MTNQLINRLCFLFIGITISFISNAQNETHDGNLTMNGITIVNSQIRTDSINSVDLLMANETASQGVGTDPNTFRLVADNDGDSTGNISHEIGDVGNVITNLKANSYTVNVNTFINGNLESKEVKVTSDSGSFPDYLFKSSYKLRSLSELDKLIKKNGHLPNVLKAAEVEANDQDLGLIQQKLLEKIEELTLYLIEQDQVVRIVQSESESLIKENSIERSVK